MKIINTAHRWMRKERFVFFTSNNFPQKSTRFRYMTPIYQAQNWKVITTNKPHKRTWKSVLIPLISLHIKKTQLHHTTPTCQGTTPSNATYIFSTLSLAAISMQFLVHLWLAKWSLHYISYTSTWDLYHLNTIIVQLYNAAALTASCLCSAGLLAIILNSVNQRMFMSLLMYLPV